MQDIGIFFFLLVTLAVKIRILYRIDRFFIVSNKCHNDDRNFVKLLETGRNTIPFSNAVGKKR